MKYVSIRVRDSGGRPQAHVRVGIFVSQFAASGAVSDQYTDSDGETNFSLDIDDGAEITVYINGQERVSRGRVRAEYFLTI
jgi:hypothetical protein